MTPVTWYFDFVSPYSYLQSARLGEFGGRAEITPVPVLFAGLLNHWGTSGPAELAPKRLWTYRFCQWYGDSRGIPFRMPPAHPFNPIKPLRLAIALGSDLDAIHGIFRFIWAEGRDPNAEFAALADALGVEDAEAKVGNEAVKDALRANTEAAVAKGVYGVPTLEIAGELFWGVDGTDFARAYLDDPAILETPEMKRIEDLPSAAQRK